MKRIVFFAALLMLSTWVFAQSKEDLEEANILTIRAIELVDAGQYEEGIKMLEQAEKLDPKNSEYQYEIAYAEYSQKQFEEANKRLKSIINKKDATDFYYQLLGNTYDYLGDPDKALETYQDGMKKFPNSGKLHLEQAVVYITQKKYNEAVAVLEDGVIAEPDYASNYFYLTLFYAESDNPIFAALYGEIFINLERNSTRTRKISEVLYSIYDNCVVIEDTSATVRFSKMNMITPDMLGDMKEGFLPFNMQVDMMMGAGAGVAHAVGDTFSLAFLNNMRQSFLDVWQQGGNAKKYPNVVFDMWQTLQDKGHFEAYNYWLFLVGNPEEHDAWVTDHTEEYEAFIDYFTYNPMLIDKSNYFTATKTTGKISADDNSKGKKKKKR